MKTKLTFWGSMLFLLSLSILLTIYLAWIFYPMEIQWLNLTNRVYLKPETIQYNFHILMNYLTNPFSQVLQMPDFRSSAAGLHHFAVVKTLFHQILFVGDDTWLFDPAKDPVIMILPETFFLHAFLLFFALYENFFGYLYLKSRRK